MAIEVIQQVLAPDNAPSINKVRAEAKISEALLKNMYQGLVETNGRGISDRYATEQEINGNTQIFVNRILPVKMKPREMGASKNGGSFSADSHFTQTQTVSIEVLTVMDDTIYVPRARQDTIKTDLLAEQIDLYGRRLNTVLNGATAAAHLFSAWKSEADGNGYNAVAISDDDVANKNVTQRFIEANSLLDEGDEEHDIDVYPTDTRVAVLKMGARPILKANGVLVIGGSNYAQSILKARGVSEGSVDTTLENGYWGDIDGVPCHGLSNESLAHASEFLGFEHNELKKGAFFGYIASSYASARGVSMIEQTKVVDAVQGQGFVLQPFTKFGVVSWYALGQVILFRGDDTIGLIKELKEIFSGKATEFAGIGFKVKAAGSRLFPTISAVTASKTSGTKVTVTALDDLGTDHVKLGHYVQSDKAISTVSDFYKAIKASGSVHGDLTLNGTTTTSGLTAGKYVNVLVIADDGSCAIESVVATA